MAERALSTIVINAFGDAKSALRYTRFCRIISVLFLLDFFFFSVQPFSAVADPSGDQVKVKIQVARISNEDIRTVSIIFI